MDETKKKRQEILKRIDRLTIREKDGEDVAAELLACGQELSKLSVKPRQEKPKEPVKMSREIVSLAKSNGITYSTLQTRIYTGGWDPVKAATHPIQKRKPITETGLTINSYKKFKEVDKLTDRQIIERLEVSQHTFQDFKRKNGLSKNHKKGGIA